MSIITDAFAATAKDVAESLAPLGIPLDGSAASLADLDDAITLIWGGAGPAEDSFDGMVWGYGCYVADVIQRHHAGDWRRSEESGYDFIPHGHAVGFNPWHWVEMRFRGGDPIAPSYAAIARLTATQERPRAGAFRSTTNIAVHAMGISFASQAIDQQSFTLLTQAGLSEVEYEALLEEVQEEGDWVDGAFVDELEVGIDAAAYNCSLAKVERHLDGGLPAPYRLYEHLSVGEYLLVYEEVFKGVWRENDVAGYSHSKLRFDVECVEPSRGVNYVLVDFSYDSASLSDSATESSGGVAYVVDRQGRRHEIKRTYEW